MPPDPASPDGRSIAIRSGLLGRSVSIPASKTEYPRYEAARPLARALRSRRRMIGRSEDLLWECRAADSGLAAMVEAVLREEGPYKAVPAAGVEAWRGRGPELWREEGEWRGENRGTLLPVWAGAGGGRRRGGPPPAP